jgi:hypothetical protein
MISYGFLMVATNKYLDLWKISAQSLLLAEEGKSKITIHLFTDQPREAEVWWKSLHTTVELVTYSIPPYKWPEATLYRYKILEEHMNAITDEVLIYLDSDMIVQKAFLSELNPAEWIQGIALVSHPGFYRPKLWNGIRIRSINPYILKQDLKYLLRISRGMGSWETKKKSASYVPRLKRHQYVHGAIWMGNNNALKEMISLLAENVTQDLKNNVMAIWHDESHLNWYFSNHKVSLLDCRFSWYPSYPHLSHISSNIYSMDKTSMNFDRMETTREDN